MKHFILGTRSSPLAMAQTELTRQALARLFPEMTLEVRQFTTRGDQKLDLNLLQKGEGGGKGLFTKELEDELLAGTIDVAVHSLKDLPGNNPPGLVLSAVLERAATADLLISKEVSDFDSLPGSAVLGTSSIRRARQLQWLRPDLQICEWRGNVQTRLRKLGQSETVAGIVLAEAGLERLGFLSNPGLIVFEAWQFKVTSLAGKLLPAIGQGAIALQSAAARPEVTAILAALNHEKTMTCVRAERELQRLFSGDCSLPIGVLCDLRGSVLEMRALLFGPQGTQPATAQCVGHAAEPEVLAGEIFAALQRGLAAS